MGSGNEREDKAKKVQNVMMEAIVGRTRIEREGEENGYLWSLKDSFMITNFEEEGGGCDLLCG